MSTLTPQARASAEADPTHPLPPSAGKRKPHVLWIVLGLVAAAAGGWFYLTQRTYHLKTVQPGVLYRSGLQNFGQFENALRKVKPRTVVSLVDDREMADPAKPQFRRAVETYAGTGGGGGGKAGAGGTGGNGHGVRVERVPIPLGGWPQGDEVERFLALAADPKNQPVLVHCAQGVRRTGMMVAAYQISVLGYDKDRAKRELETFGHSERTVGDIKRFIDHYDPQTKRMTAALPQGKE